MNISSKVIGFTVVFSISLIATVKPEAFSFVRLVPYGDKFAHFILFGLLGMLSVLRARRYDPVCLWPGIMLTTGFAIADESLQLAFASRSFSATDLLANLLGILVFTIATACYCRGQSRTAQRCPSRNRRGGQ